MKYPALFSSKDKSKNIKVSSAAILLGTLRVKCITKFDHISSKFTTPAYIPLTLPALTFRKVVFDPPLPPPIKKKKKTTNKMAKRDRSHICDDLSGSELLV